MAGPISATYRLGNAERSQLGDTVRFDQPGNHTQDLTHRLQYSEPLHLPGTSWSQASMMTQNKVVKTAFGYNFYFKAFTVYTFFSLPYMIRESKSIEKYATQLLIFFIHFQVAYVLSFLSFAVISILLIRCLTLDGSTHGLLSLFVPRDAESLFTPKVL